MTGRIYGRTAASIQRLMLIKDVTEQDAKKIRHIWHTTRYRDEARKQIDCVLRTHGVEFLGVHRRSNQDVYYCNAGDTYATTVVFIVGSMYVACWGDFIERNTVKPYDQL